MKLGEMARHFRRHPDIRFGVNGKAEIPRLPVMMDVEFVDPVSRDEHVVEGVKEIKQTPWYRRIKRDGLHFVPHSYQNGHLIVLVGTAAALGGVYLTYKELKRRVHKHS